MGAWDDMAAELNAATDAGMGEPVTILPQRPGKYQAGGPDPDRPPLTVTGVPASKPEGPLDAGGRATNWRTSITAEAAYVSFALTEFPLGQAQWPRPNDHLRLDHQAGQPVVSVTSADVDAGGRLNCSVARVKGPNP